GILSTVGDTPLIPLRRVLSNRRVRIYGKLEFFNPGGSIKDRSALSILQEALDSGEVVPGDRVIESSSGNMAIGLAQICRFHGLQLVVVVDPKLNAATARILAAYGAEVEVVTEPLGDGGFLGARLKRVEELVNEHRPDGRNFWPNQYRNVKNPIAHLTTMREIVDAMGEAPDYVFIATSTCGTLMGCADYLSSIRAETKIVAVDAAGSVIFGGATGERKIPGHGAGCRSHFLDPSVCHSVERVSDRDCVKGCHRLMDREAILAGGSSGGVTTAAERYFHRERVP
ncbi:UNVERIFIED_CONTAM: hypothetical protein GTU68_050098, partial [Idotea baltica]|nr:hypothetical protein [Idotea baltica]